MLEKLDQINCPICSASNSENILELDCGNLDNSILYRNLIIKSCKNCGHIYNELTNKDIQNLMEYYNNEYAPTNIGGSNLGGDRPGSSNDFTLKRHSQLFDLFQNNISKDSKILDIGCAMGGMLSYLKKQDYNYLYGIDVTKKYIDIAKKNKEFDIQFGSADDIPFENNFFDLLIIDQVMEHLVNPRKAFQEAKRVLKKNGFFCIGVPDAQRYGELYFFDFYWFLMREHIQHFDLTHLKLIAESEGFELVNYSQSDSPMMSQTMILPNLNVLFRYTGKSDICKDHDNFELLKKMKVYIKNDFQRLKNKQSIVENLFKEKKPVLVWGIGREFLYLYENTKLKNCNIVSLIDSNRFKQVNNSVDAREINAFTNAYNMDNVTVIITALAHYESIVNLLLDNNFKGEIIHLDGGVGHAKLS